MQLVEIHSSELKYLSLWATFHIFTIFTFQLTRYLQNFIGNECTLHMLATPLFQTNVSYRLCAEAAVIIYPFKIVLIINEWMRFQVLKNIVLFCIFAHHTWSSFSVPRTQRNKKKKKQIKREWIWAIQKLWSSNNVTSVEYLF